VDVERGIRGSPRAFSRKRKGFGRNVVAPVPPAVDNYRSLLSRGGRRVRPVRFCRPGRVAVRVDSRAGRTLIRPSVVPLYAPVHSPVALAKERLTRSTDVETRGISRRPVGPARPHHPVLWLTSGRTATANPRDARVPTYCAPLGTSRAPSPLRAATTPAQFMLRPVPSSSRGRRRLLNPTFHHLQKTPRSTPTPNQGRVASRAVSQIRDVGREFY